MVCAELLTACWSADRLPFDGTLLPQSGAALRAISVEIVLRASSQRLV